MIQIYWGDGKGKTTAAIGQLLRVLGYGQKAVMVQFLKSTPSGEVTMLERLGATVLRGKASDKFVSAMTEEEKALTTQIHNENLTRALAELSGGKGCLVLDEYLDALAMGLVDASLLQPLLEACPEDLELVVTGHTLTGFPTERADYITHVLKQKHPYDRGVKARKGIEF